MKSILVALILVACLPAIVTTVEKLHELGMDLPEVLEVIERAQKKV